MSIDQRGRKTRISYQLIRNVTSPEEKVNGIQTFFANVPANEIVDIGTENNLRTYIPEHKSKKRNSVHKAIESTINREADRFINRNSGVTITCSSIEVDDKKQVAVLTDASIINGAQTQGEIRRHLSSLMDEDDNVWPVASFHVRAEINVDPIQPSVVETAIARNTATGVQSISQAGARGHLDELAKAIEGVFDQSIRKSETDTDVIETFQVLQYVRLLMPSEVSKNNSASEMLKPYKNRAKCLEEFSSWFTNRATDVDDKVKYDFMIQMAPIALREYAYWEAHDAWNGNYIWEDTKKGGRAVRKDKTGRIVWVSPGIIFPIMNAMSAFAVQGPDEKWTLEKPKLFKPEEMIKKAVAQFRALDSKPMDMGRSESAYEALLTYPSTIVEVMRDFEDET